MTAPPRSPRRFLKPLAFVLFLAALWGVNRHFGITDDMSVEGVRAQIAALGPWGKLAYLGLWLFLQPLGGPAAPVTVAGGLLFGWVWGAVLAETGLILGSLTHFVLVRWAFRDAAQAWMKRRFPDLPRKLETKGVAWMVTLRWFWLLSAPLSVASALTRMSPWRFIATVLATAPGAIMFALIGDGIGTWGLAHMPASRWACIGITVVLGVGAYATLLVRYPELRPGRSKDEKPEDEEPGPEGPVLALPGA